MTRVITNGASFLSAVLALAALVHARQATRSSASSEVSSASLAPASSESVSATAESAVDRAMQRRVREALAKDPMTDSRAIQLAVQAGRVALSGTVDSYLQRAAAYDDVSRIAGTRRIDDRLRVRSINVRRASARSIDPLTPEAQTEVWYVTAPRPTVADSDLARRIQQNFEWSPFALAHTVAVRVQGSRVTLIGTVPSFRARQTAVDDALEAGAVIVRDELQVDSTPAARDPEPPRAALEPGF